MNRMEKRASAYTQTTPAQAIHSIKCECGTEYEPMTDSYTCPYCGTENYPEDTDATHDRR